MSFPRTEVAGVSLSRMIIGTNWMLGYSHTGEAADKQIRERYSNKDAFYRILKQYQEYGIDTLMGPISSTPGFIDAIKYSEDKIGKGFILVDTPALNVENSPEARREAEAQVKKSADMGCRFCLIHHAAAELLVSKLHQSIDRIDDYTGMIRDNGMIPGLSAHMPELVTYSDLNGYDVETYIQIYNCLNFMMQVEVESVAKIIHNAKKPVMTIKSMAAGRTTPYVGLTFSYSTIRPCDMVTVGAYTAEEVDEDVEIALAAIEHRFPNLSKRSSPVADQDAFGGTKIRDI